MGLVEFENWDNMTVQQQAEIIKRNNPNGLPTGAYTGRCQRCGSNDLWDDVTWYGCNCCGEWYPNIR